jgi:hypothetical protein
LCRFKVEPAQDKIQLFHSRVVGFDVNNFCDGFGLLSQEPVWVRLNGRVAVSEIGTAT